VPAGAADMHNLVADRFGVDDALPCADYALLVPLKRSREYASIRKRVTDLRPADAWQKEGFHFFVFDLRAPNGAGSTAAEPPVAVFAMHPELKEPVSAVVVTPGLEGQDAEVSDLRQPESVYTAAMSG
jgi:hypothetical protein